MRRSKYGNKKTVIHGIKFDSKKEADRYLDLLLLQKAGEISNLELQPVFEIFIAPIEWMKADLSAWDKEKVFNSVAKGRAAFKYKADFSYVQGGARVIEDVKGYKTAIYRLKKKCVEAQYGIKILEV